MAEAGIGTLLRAKFEALIGVDPDRSYSDTLREYFINRSGVGADSGTPTSFYMHTTFDNESLAEGYVDMRFRLLFIKESAATDAMPWGDAAVIWTGTAPTLPVMNKFSPKTGPIATLVVLTITGGNFTPATTVNFGTTLALVPSIIQFGSSLQVTIPGADPNLVAPGFVNVSVNTASGTSGSLVFKVI